MASKYQVRRETIDRWKLEKGCVDCGYAEAAVALDFDHVTGIKHFSIADSNNQTWDAIKREMAKCEVVCSNCHRIRTYRRRTGIDPRITRDPSEGSR